MAQKMIEQDTAEIEAKRSKRSVGAPIFSFPSQKDNHFVVCLASGQVAQSMFFMDRAENSWPVLSPFIGALFLHNIKSLSHSDDSADRELAERFAPGAAARMIQSMFSRLTANDTLSGRCVINTATRDSAAAVIKGKTGPQRKFLDALKIALENAPLRFRPDKSKPFLPISYAHHCGFTSAEILPEMAKLMEMAQDFEAHWGWHGKDILRDADYVYQKRKDKRNAKKATYTVEKTDYVGNVIERVEFTDFREARAAFRQKTWPEMVDNCPWRRVVAANLKKIKDEEEDEKEQKDVIREPQEEEVRAGRIAVRIYRTKENLKNLLQRAKASTSSAPLICCGTQNDSPSSEEPGLADDE